MIVNLIVIIISLFIGMVFLELENTSIPRKRNILKYINNASLKKQYLSNYYDNNQKNRKRYITIICLILIFQSGLRHVAVGADTYAYFLQFESVKKMNWGKIYTAVINHYLTGEGKDPGYLVFQKLILYIIPYYQLYLFVIAIIFFSAFGYFVYKNAIKISDIMFIFILYSCLFYSFFSITGHRQTIATAGTLFGFEFIKKRKILPFLLIIILVSTIHKSCLIFILLYFIAPVKKTNLLFWSVLLFPILLMFSGLIASFIQQFSDDYNEYKHFDNLQPITFTIMMLLIGISSLLFYKRTIKKQPQTVYSYNAFALAIIFTSLVFAIHGYMRIVQYFSIFMLILIPNVFKSIENNLYKTRQVVYFICVMLLITMSIRANWKVEYKFYWQQMNLGANYNKY